MDWCTPHRRPHTHTRSSTQINQRTVLVGGVQELRGDEAVGAHCLGLHPVEARRQPDCGCVGVVVLVLLVCALIHATQKTHTNARDHTMSNPKNVQSAILTKFLELISKLPGLTSRWIFPCACR